MSVKTEREEVGFARLVVTSAGSQPEQTRLDVAKDVIEHPFVDNPIGQTLHPEELAVNKILAMFDRGEARDLDDLAQIDAHYRLQDLLVSAKAKDHGFEPGAFAEMLRLSARRPDGDFPSDDLAPLRRWASELAEAVQRGMPLPPGPRRPATP
jgi:hypothetical protein